MLQKEFTQIFRNRVILPAIFVIPFVQLVVLVFAANLEMKEIKYYVVNQDRSSFSRTLQTRFQGSPFYSYKGTGHSIEEGIKMLTRGDVDMVLHLENGFERDLIRNQKSSVQVLIDAVNSTEAGLINAYTGNIIRDVNEDLILELIQYIPSGGLKNVNISTAYWYNPDLNYHIYMVPGILVILVTLIGMFLTALNLVREKELGTTEQINVTPVKKYQFIISKLLPFWIIALFELSLGLILGRIIFQVPFLGSISLLFGFASVYLLVVLGFGLFLSSLSSNQQQVMFLSFFFMLTFILMSGIFTPVESMPDWAQKINIINPLAYFMKVIRMIMLKGSVFNDIKSEFFSLLIYANLILGLAVWSYRKTS
jgi:ABC-2 type transport system permease protein